MTTKAWKSNDGNMETQRINLFTAINDGMRVAMRTDDTAVSSFDAFFWERRGLGHWFGLVNGGER